MCRLQWHICCFSVAIILLSISTLGHDSYFTYCPKGECDLPETILNISNTDPPSAKRKSCPAVDFSFAKHKSNEIPLLRETGCSTKPLATEAVLIFLNNSLRKCILSLSDKKKKKKKDSKYAFELLRKCSCPSQFLFGKIHSPDLGNTKTDPKTCSKKSSKLKNASKSQWGCNNINNVLKTKSSIPLIRKWPRCTRSRRKVTLRP